MYAADHGLYAGWSWEKAQVDDGVTSLSAENFLAPKRPEITCRQHDGRVQAHTALSFIPTSSTFAVSSKGFSSVCGQLLMLGFAEPRLRTFDGDGLPLHFLYRRAHGTNYSVY